MAAIIHSTPCSPPHQRPGLRLLAGGPPPRRAPTPRSGHRRLTLGATAAALALAVSVVGWLALQAYAPPPPARPPSAPAAAPVAPPELAAAPVVVVRAGDSLWSIARRLHPNRDPRPIVTRLARYHGWGPLQPGERLPVP